MNNKTITDNYSVEDMGIIAERTYYLLKTISDGYYEMDAPQRESLVGIALTLSGDIHSWMGAEEVRRRDCNASK
jgi:hypothetical protein